MNISTAMGSQALFREIHKNTWLKRINGDNRKTTVINTKKSEKYWVVFCVHDDTFALLEGYSEPKFAPSHIPEWTIPLQTTQHISHALVPQENEFEFVITLMNDVARFNAPSWELMLEWVEALRSKLREMKILSPKENVYSKLPEIRAPLLPTRDPTSPLPVLPPVPAAIVPGIERLYPPSTQSSNQTRTSSTAPSNGSERIAMSNTNVQNIMNLLSNPLEAYSTNHHTNGEAENPVPDIQPSVAENIPEATSDEIENNLENEEEPAATNITIIQVSTPPSEKKTLFEFTDEEFPDEEYRSNVQIIPSNPAPTTSLAEPSTSNTNNNATTTEIAVKGKPNIYKTPHKSKTKITNNAQNATKVSTTVQVSSATSEYGQVFACSTTSSATTVVDIHSAMPSSHQETPPSLPTTQHYEQIFLSTSAPASNARDLEEPSTSTGVRVASPPKLAAKRSVEVQSNAANRPNVLQRGLTEVSITRPSRRDEPTTAQQSANSRSRGPGASNKNTPGSQVDKFRGENHGQRQRSSSTSDMHAGNRARSILSPVALPQQNHARLQPAPQPYRSANPLSENGTRMTLREQQVMHMRREMMHPGGVRLQLRRKDCCGSIAWIDAFGGVWVAGWKQKEHPVLYNALHIGDQLLSVAGQQVTSAAEANKLIRACQGLFVEMIIRRVPFGRVYAIRRELEAQCLGLIRDGNTATIVDVVPNSLAARFGLPPKAKTVDGLNLTFWVLTEINGRPLNLFFKDTEIKDRLNSVGRDISILVQPSDLITKLKKQLKSLRSYKDFIVQ
ncbi:uncharacterized protein LOC134833151 [Culicoides brevitarsis]|uniref:uncharacterized protein LOC134833151 n=1 Tax=Culicoides brevitarsis TaxID=469753 RepID=UPI00307C133F